MRRRDLIAAFGATALSPCVVARAQQPENSIVGVLSPGTPERSATVMAAWRRALGDSGFIEGQNFAIEYRWAGNDQSQLPNLAANLVGRAVNAIYSPTIDAAKAAKQATATIPIVFSYIIDPVGLGLVESTGRPGGNATGVVALEQELLAKRLELLHEAVPTAARIGYLAAGPQLHSRHEELDRLAAAAKHLGVELIKLIANGPEEVEPALADGKRMGIGALVIQAHPVFYAEQKRLAEHCMRYALPAARTGQFAEQGGFISYTADRDDVAYKAGAYIGRILNGAKPADLPLAQPTKFRLVINLTTAKALGLTVPQSLLIRADEVIE